MIARTYLVADEVSAAVENAGARRAMCEIEKPEE
jgi:hypothetical protein